MSARKKVAIVFGTRPEAIKMAPVVKAVEASGRLQPIRIATAQHRGLLDQVLEYFGIKPDHDLNLMQANQDLFHVTAACLNGMKGVLQETRPDVVLVQGDTTTTLAAAMAAFYLKIPVGHVEAGLRTYDKYSPFPEEMNRKMTGAIADFHFAPTEQSVDNLRREAIPDEKIHLTGNTAIDALLWASRRAVPLPALRTLYEGRRLILMTAHRRENFGTPLQNIFRAVREFAARNSDCHVIYPVHPNPNVKGPAEEALGGLDNVSLVPPVGYSELVYLMTECTLVLTDSGGLQEEAPTLGKPVLVLRETTERPEAVAAGCARLVGHDTAAILGSLDELLKPGSATYTRMARARNPFGDGTAARQIAALLEEHL